MSDITVELVDDVYQITVDESPVEVTFWDGNVTLVGGGYVPPSGDSGYVDLYSDIYAGGDTVGTGGSLTNDSVTNAYLANMPGLTIKGNPNGSTADPQDLTAGQVAAILPNAATSTKGLVTPPGGVDNYLRADGAWAAPPSSGGGVTIGDKGDITVSDAGATWTIDQNAVTDAKLADITGPALKGRVSGYGNPENLTPAQVADLLPTATSSVKGLVSPPGGTVFYYRSDGQWAVPGAYGGVEELAEWDPDGVYPVGALIKRGNDAYMKIAEDPYNGYITKGKVVDFIRRDFVTTTNKTIDYAPLVDQYQPGDKYIAVFQQHTGGASRSYGLPNGGVSWTQVTGASGGIAMSDGSYMYTDVFYTDSPVNAGLGTASITASRTGRLTVMLCRGLSPGGPTMTVVGTPTTTTSNNSAAYVTALDYSGGFPPSDKFMTLISATFYRQQGGLEWTRLFHNAPTSHPSTRVGAGNPPVDDSATVALSAPPYRYVQAIEGKYAAAVFTQEESSTKYNYFGANLLSWGDPGVTPHLTGQVAGTQASWPVESSSMPYFNKNVWCKITNNEDGSTGEVINLNKLGMASSIMLKLDEFNASYEVDFDGDTFGYGTARNAMSFMLPQVGDSNGMRHWMRVTVRSKNARVDLIPAQMTQQSRNERWKLTGFESSPKVEPDLNGIPDSLTTVLYNGETEINGLMEPGGEFTFNYEWVPEHRMWTVKSVDGATTSRLFRRLSRQGWSPYGTTTFDNLGVDFFLTEELWDEYANARAGNFSSTRMYKIVRDFTTAVPSEVRRAMGDSGVRMYLALVNPVELASWRHIDATYGTIFYDGTVNYQAGWLEAKANAPKLGSYAGVLLHEFGHLLDWHYTHYAKLYGRQYGPKLKAASENASLPAAFSSGYFSGYYSSYYNMLVTDEPSVASAYAGTSPGEWFAEFYMLCSLRRCIAPGYITQAAYDAYVPLVVGSRTDLLPTLEQHLIDWGALNPL